MESLTNAVRTQRPFAVSGVPVMDGPGVATVAPVPVSARIVRDGEVLPVETVAGGLPAWRVVGNAVALFALVLFVGLGFLALGPLALGYRPVVVGSGSMEPALKVADVVVVKDPEHKNVGLGTVVDIRTDDGGKIHRVVEVVPDGFRTKGDANATVDSDIVAAESITGVGVFLVPFVGLPRVWFDNGEWLKLGSLIAAIVAAAYFSRSDWLRAGRRTVDGAR